jgi:hypothetical protein
MAAAVGMLSFAPFALCQNDPTQLTVSPGAYAVNSFSYQSKGLFGATSSAPSTLKGPAGSAASDDSDPTIPAIRAPGFYPDDVTNPGDHATVFSAQSHPLYVDSSPSTWGKVGTFLTDVGNSDFIHVLDQYVGSYSSDRYTLGQGFLIGYPIPANHTLETDDLLAIVHAAAAIDGSGLHNIYHIFLPPGVDTCFPPASPGAAPQCYSPDNPPTFYFCAYHSAVTFSDSVGHVLFTVEPYQNVPGCQAPPNGTANNQLIDSTDDSLSHELSETISDPNLNAWWVHRYTFAQGNEIGDMCVRYAVKGNNLYSHNGTIELNGHPYTIQPEYSNQVHGCSYTPADGE